jgi:hypothetical protein
MRKAMVRNKTVTIIKRVSMRFRIYSFFKRTEPLHVYPNILIHSSHCRPSSLRMVSYGKQDASTRPAYHKSESLLHILCFRTCSKEAIHSYGGISWQHLLQPQRYLALFRHPPLMMCPFVTDSSHIFGQALHQSLSPVKLVAYSIKCKWMIPTIMSE